MKRLSIAGAFVALAVAATASAAYFHEARRDGFVWASDLALKKDFVVTDPLPSKPMMPPEAAEIAAQPPVAGLAEKEGWLRVPSGQCSGDEDAVAKCERKWESGNLGKVKAVASRSGSALTLSPQSGSKLVLTDWEKCSDEGECDGERFVVLGPLKRATTIAIEIDYQHDSPSLLLFDTKTGKGASVHYGSEPTFLNGSETAMVSFEDLNDASTVIVTRLEPEGPAIEVQCRGARTESSSFGLTFKRWVSDDAFDVMLLKAGQSMAARFEKTPEGPWTLKSPVALKNEGFECRQRPAAKAAPGPATPPRSS